VDCISHRVSDCCVSWIGTAGTEVGRKPVFLYIHNSYLFLKKGGEEENLSHPKDYRDITPSYP
jgi:hypothetical protein